MTQTIGQLLYLKGKQPIYTCPEKYCPVSALRDVGQYFSGKLYERNDMHKVDYLCRLFGMDQPSYRSIDMCRMVVALFVGLICAIYPQAVSAQTLPDPNDEIIFIDFYGHIHVLDTTVLGEKQVEWYSPDHSFRNIAVGDVNNDGDYEIIAIKGEGGEGKLVVYDPVVNSAAVTADGTINDIPWKTLHERLVGGTPTFVEAGNLITATPGDEIIYGVDIGGGRSRLVILSAADGEPRGNQWTEQRSEEFDRIWKHIAVGELLEGGPEEIVLIDHTEGNSRIAVYRLDDESLQERAPLFRENDADKLWQRAVIGQIYAGGTGEIAVIRETPFGVPCPNFNECPRWTGPDNAFIFQYDVNNRDDPGDAFLDIDQAENPNQDLDDGFFFWPKPQRIFLADINGSGDDELFFLRSTPNSNQRVQQLLGRNRGNDTLGNLVVVTNVQSVDGDENRLVIEQNLATNNLLPGAAGAGGDVDGDGKDEIVIIRKNQIVVYHEPDVNFATTRQDNLVSTDGRNLKIADLDKNGFEAAPTGAQIVSPNAIAKIGHINLRRIPFSRNIY